MKFICPITSLKFVGTISLGLLTVCSMFINYMSILVARLACIPYNLAKNFSSLASASSHELMQFHQGVSYTTSSTILPSLALLPSAASARNTLTHIQTQATRQILTLASISSLSLVTAYTLASARGKHPYLLWVALMSFIGGQGVEYYFNGLERFYILGGTANSTSKSPKSPGKSLRESGYVDLSSSTEVEEVNGEKVEIEMNRERRTQNVRSIVAGLGFLMGVVGIWGDGA